MGKPKEFRDKSDLLHYREFLREHTPSGPEGCVHEDVDLLCRVYGPNFAQDQIGKFRIIEVKTCAAESIATAQLKTFGLLDSTLTAADPHGWRYGGFYVVYTETNDWRTCQDFCVNGMWLYRRDFIDWCRWEITVCRLDVNEKSGLIELDVPSWTLRPKIRYHSSLYEAP